MHFVRESGGSRHLNEPPEAVAAEPHSFTGRYLKPLLERRPLRAAKAAAQGDVVAAKRGADPLQARKSRVEPR